MVGQLVARRRDVSRWQEPRPIEAWHVIPVGESAGWSATLWPESRGGWHIVNRRVSRTVNPHGALARRIFAAITAAKDAGE
jgi:hypothetical protein